MDKLFQIFLPRPDLQSCRSCSVVGNSVSLRRSNYGPLIDSQDVVKSKCFIISSSSISTMLIFVCVFFFFCIFRMNNAQIKSYESDVGTKTTHHVMYPESAVDLDNSTHLVLFPFKIQDLEWLIQAFSTGFNGTWVIGFIRFVLLFCRHDHLDSITWHCWLFVAVFLPSHVCDNADIHVLNINNVNISVLTWAASDKKSLQYY